MHIHLFTPTGESTFLSHQMSIRNSFLLLSAGHFDDLQVLYNKKSMLVHTARYSKRSLLSFLERKPAQHRALSNSTFLIVPSCSVRVFIRPIGRFLYPCCCTSRSPPMYRFLSKKQTSVAAAPGSPPSDDDTPFSFPTLITPPVPLLEA